MELDSRQTIIIAILVLYLGRFLDRRFTVFRKFNIPEAVTGGTVVAVMLAVIYLISGVEFEFDMYYRDVLLIIFFTTIGLSTKWQTFMKGGKLFRCDDGACHCLPVHPKFCWNHFHHPL